MERLDISMPKSEASMVDILYKTCIFCNSQKQLKSIHKNHFDEGKYENYSDMLIVCFNIKMIRGTSEIKICNDCIESLRSAYKFRENVELANICLQKHFKSVNPCKKLIKSENFPFANSKSKKNCDDDYSSEEFSGEFELDFDSNDNETRFNNSSNEEKKDSNIKIKTEISESQSLTDRSKISDFTEFFCDICGRAHLDKDSLANHVAGHTKQRLTCKLCSRSYANSGSLSQHVRSCHQGIKTYCCTMCPERFSDYFSRNMHLTNVHNQPCRNYICSICGKMFFRSSRLSIHIRRDHDKLKNFTCTECNKMFFSSSELKMHSLSHSSIE